MVETLRDQLMPLRESFRKTHPVVRQVVNITATLDGGSDNAIFTASRDTVLRWLQARAGTLPAEAWRGESFEHMTPGRYAAGVKINVPEGEYWAVRCDDPDKTIPGRTWTTEAALGRQGNKATFGVRLVVATTEDKPEFVSSVPGIVRQLASYPGLIRNGRRLSTSPLLVDSDERLDLFIDLLLDPRRRNPIFAISLDEDVNDPFAGAVNADFLAARCLGLAHVAVISGPQAFGLSDTIGRQLSVFRRAVRTYRPGMTIDDDPFRHPLARSSQIEEWRDGGQSAFTNMLIEAAASNSIRAIDSEADLPTFTKAKQVALRQQRADAKGDSDYPALLGLAELELDEKQREISGLESIIAEEEAKRAAVEERLDELEGTNTFLRSRIVDLENARLESTQKDPSKAYPTDFGGMSDWADDSLSGRIKILPRAQREAKDAQFQDITLVYKSLEYLAGPFWQMKTKGGQELLVQNDKALADLGIKNEPCGAEHLLKEQGDTFEVQWGPRNRKRLLDLHLKNGGNTRDPSRCLRIYYFWDSDTQTVVVGSLPSHLNTRAT